MHFESFKPHHRGSTEFVTTPLDTGEIATVMDSVPELSVEPINDDLSQPSYKSEKLLSEASNVSLPSHRRHWMKTRHRTKLCAGGSRPHYQQFDCSTSDTDDENSGPCCPSSSILRTWTNPKCLQTNILSLYPLIPCLTSLSMTAYLSYFLITSSRAHRHHNCRLQTTHQSNP